MSLSNPQSIRRFRSLALLASGVFLAFVLAAPAQQAEARGGARAGGTKAYSSVSGANRASAGNYNRGAANAGNYNRGNANRGNVNTGNVNRGNVNAGNVNRGNVNTGNVNRGNINTGNVNRGNINTGDINIGNDINIDIDRDYGWHGDIDYPIAAGIAVGAAIGAVAVTTAAVVGSAYYALPPSGCVTVIRNGFSYYQCGTVYYQQTWQGSDVVYVVVNP
jgi:PPE-repeat protein